MSTFFSMRTSAALFASIILVACSSGGSGGDANPVSQSELDNPSTNNILVETGVDAMVVPQAPLSWKACASTDRLECANILVPMDYADPTGDSITLALFRFNRGGAARSRTLFMNPGGPGSPGFNFIKNIELFGDVSNTVRDTFDVVSFDPRGIGESTELVCDQSSLFTQDNYPVNIEELEFTRTKSIEFAQSCGESTGAYLQQVGSYNVVRDINEMRKALNLTQIDFLGYSYGTRLAALYLQMFPESSGRFILDGSMAPTPEVAILARGSLIPGQANIDAIAQACVDGICEAAQFSSQLQARVDELNVGSGSLETALLNSILIFAGTRPGFENVLVGSLSRYLESQDIRELEFLDSRLGVSEERESREINESAFVAVMCADDATRPTLDSVEALRGPFNVESDLFAEPFLNTAGLCAGWPEALNPVPEIATNQAPVSLVIGGPTDAQTPLVFSEQMAQALGGQFLRSEHDGHVTVFTGKNLCTQALVNDFLVNGSLPTVSVCEANNRNAIIADWPMPMLQLLQ